MNINHRNEVVVEQDEIDSMNAYITKVKAINDQHFEETGKRRLSCVVTYGCQMNVHDSEKLTGILNACGYEPVNDEVLADIIIYNTCCVRENAENRVYGNLGYLKHVKESKKDLKIAVCGCMMQQDAVVEKIKQSYRNVDIIFGTFNLHRFPELLYTNLETNRMVIDIWESHGDIYEEAPVTRRDPFKGYVNIMYGCDNFCSYCIVPYVRGRERSRPMSDILEEINNLAKNGVIEITLLGQNVNSYGKNTPGAPTFARLLREIDKIVGIQRIRFMTSHPKDLSDELIEAIRDCDSVCKHLHLPFQSGSSRVLAAMNRKYTKESYLNLVEKIKTAVPDIKLSTDIIVGFPGETEEDFTDTLEVVEKVRFSTAYTFIYSKRSHTPAASMDNQIPEDISGERFKRLVALVNKIAGEISREYVGYTIQVLAEEYDHEKNVFTGRTECNNIVHFTVNHDTPVSQHNIIGKIIDVKIVDCKTFYLMGEI